MKNSMKVKLGQRLRLLGGKPYHFLDSLYISLDRKHIRRTRNIRLIPNENNRSGGKYSYAEWAHVIGIFQTLMYMHLDVKEDNAILDVGCGAGLLGIASEPFLGKKGRYVGIDVSKKDIEFCHSHYPSRQFSFIHLDVKNPAYAPHKKNGGKKWDIEDNSFDLVTALSVWTHLNEGDAKFYFKEISRVLKSNGRALITFFLLDDLYKKSLDARTKAKGRFHMTFQDKWIFDQSAYGSEAWFSPIWAKPPESAIGVTREGLNSLMIESGLNRIAFYPGNWKEVPGVFFQDVVVFEKAQ